MARIVRLKRDERAANLGRSIYTWLIRRVARQESMAGAPCADSWFPRRSDLGGVPFSQVFGSLWDHRSRHHRTGGPRTRDRASDAASSHRETAHFTAFSANEFDGPTVTPGRVGHYFVASHVERNGLRRSGLRCRSHYLPADSWTEHRAKVARDGNPGSFGLRHCSCNSTQRAPSDVAH